MTNVVPDGALNADLLTEFDKATPLSHSSTSLVLGGSQGFDYFLDGTDFGDFTRAGVPRAGTLNTFAITRGDRVVAEWSNIGADVDKFLHFMATGNVAAVGNLVFGGNDSFDLVGTIDGAPAVVYNGYAGNDLFHVNLSLHGAAIETDGGAGHDTFNYDANFDAATDRIDGGTGVDTLNLTGGSAADLTFTAASMVNVERVVLATGVNYTMTMSDGNVAAGQTLAINAAQLTTRYSLNFDGHAETDGSYIVLGGHLNDVIVAGQGADSITGGAGADMMTGGLGADTFNFAGRFGQDTITDFAATGAGHDILHFANFASFEAMAPHMATVGTDVVITFSATDSVTLQHVSPSDLTAADFTFG